MATRTFAPWVEPIAARLRDSRRDIVIVAHSVPDEVWDRPSPNEVWTYKDLLAHLATGDWVCQGVLRAVTNRAGYFVDEIDDGNARLLEERRRMSVSDLIAEVEAEGEETQELLAELKEEHEELTREGAPMSLGHYLQMFPGHDEQHLAQLRTALEGQSEQP